MSDGLRNPFSRAFWRSRRPPHAFVLTRDRLVYVGPADGARRSALSVAPAFRVVSRPVPPDTFAPGEDGSPLAGPALSGALQRLLAEAGAKIPAASLVVPDGWVKLLVIDAVQPESHAREVDDMLRWKFGRAFGEPAGELRLSWQPAGAGTDGTRVLALAAAEQAASSWEAPFEKAGIRIGALETAAFAVSSLGARTIGDGFLVWTDDDTATTLVFTGSQLRFARTRPYAEASEAVQDVRHAVAFGMPDRPPEAPPADVAGKCAAGPPESRVLEDLRAFRAAAGASEPDLLTLSRLAPGATVTPSAAAQDPATLAALGALAGGD
ncbi:MAG TPA: hypothetical protein VLJ18_07505 [Thermoanaerobaculia bacterium]|nr:hypothetical protein [Thermoanaerobaculia bacterium]